MPTRGNRYFLLQILLLAQYVSGTIMPITGSSRVLYSWLPPVVLGAWFSSSRYGVELRVVCSVCGLLQPVNVKHDYTNCCLYRVDPPDDEQQACSKHVEAYYSYKLRVNSASCWFILYGYISRCTINKTLKTESTVLVVNFVVRRRLHQLALLEKSKKMEEIFSLYGVKC
jgi:hypothetical protein